MNKSVQTWRNAVAAMGKGIGILLIMPVLYFSYLVYGASKATYIVQSNQFVEPGVATYYYYDLDNSDTQTGFDEQQFVLDLYRFKVVMLYWHFTALVGFWTFPQVIAVISLIQATSKHVRSEIEESALLLLWRRTQVIFLVFESAFLFFVELCKTKLSQAAVSQGDVMSTYLVKFTVISQVVFVCLCVRSLFLCIVLHYEKVRVAAPVEEHKQGSKV